MPSVILLERPVCPDHTVPATCQDCGDHGYTTQKAVEMTAVAKRCQDCYYIWLIRGDRGT